MHTITGGSMKKMKMLLLGLIVLNPLSVNAYSNYIVASGQNIGIEINSKGLMVVGFYKIDGKLNKNDISIGDYIRAIDNTSISTIDELVTNIDKYQKDGKVKLTIEHDGKTKDITFKLVESNGIYKTGLYVKDSISGIGTLTYIDPETKIYGALGHEIIESNSNKRIEVKDGSIFKSEVSSIDRSTDGNPGTKNAKFYSGVTYGDINKNTIHGIYGEYSKNVNDELVEVGSSDDLQLGKALIRTVIEGSEVKEYEINITKIDKNTEIKNIYFEITDKELLDECGGIVQGMSGSPILQNGKIYGAVTHVVVENVKKGYGVFITTMLEEGER